MLYHGVRNARGRTAPATHCRQKLATKRRNSSCRPRCATPASTTRDAATIACNTSERPGSSQKASVNDLQPASGQKDRCIPRLSPSSEYHPIRWECPHKRQDAAQHSQDFAGTARHLARDCWCHWNHTGSPFARITYQKLFRWFSVIFPVLKNISVVLRIAVFQNCSR